MRYPSSLSTPLPGLVLAVLCQVASAATPSASMGSALPYSPTMIAPGSSVSHFTTEATPKLLMEPSINAGRTHEIEPPRDLTLPLLRDIGW